MLTFAAPLLLAACTSAAPSTVGTRARLSKAITPQAVRPQFNNAMRKVVRDVSRKAAEDTLGPGTAPLGKFWDPAGFTKGLSPNELKKYREAEITHGRVSMLGVLGFLTQEAFHPLFGGNIDGPAIKQFDEITRMAPTFWYPVLLAIAVAELGRARLGWQDPTSGGAMFSLRDEYEPGNIGFDPLNLKPSNPTDLASIKNKELNNGRLAMLALAGFVAQELVNGKPILG